MSQNGHKRSQTLVDNRVPENVLVEGIEDTLKTLQNQDIKWALLQVIRKRCRAIFRDYSI